MGSCVPLTGTVDRSTGTESLVKKGVLTPATGKIGLPAVIAGVAAAAIGGLMMAGILPHIGSIGTYALLGGGGALTLGGIVLLALAYRTAKNYNSQPHTPPGGGTGTGIGSDNPAIGGRDGAPAPTETRTDLGRGGVHTSGEEDTEF